MSEGGGLCVLFLGLSNLIQQLNDHAFTYMSLTLITTLLICAISAKLLDTKLLYLEGRINGTL